MAVLLSVTFCLLLSQCHVVENFLCYVIDTCRDVFVFSASFIYPNSAFSCVVTCWM